MQAPRTNPLTTFEKSELRDTLQDILGDADAKTVVTYKPFTSETLTIKTGAITRTETSSSIDVIRREMTSAEVDRSGGTLKLTDKLFLVDQDDLAAEPKVSDRIVEGSNEYEVVKWRGGVLGLIWEIAARKV